MRTRSRQDLHQKLLDVPLSCAGARTYIRSYLTLYYPVQVDTLHSQLSAYEIALASQTVYDFWYKVRPRSRRDRAEIAPRSRRDRDEIATRSRRDRAEIQLGIGAAPPCNFSRHF